jgi:hypothetical protein
VQLAKQNINANTLETLPSKVPAVEGNLQLLKLQDSRPARQGKLNPFGVGQS